MKYIAILKPIEIILPKWIAIIFLLISSNLGYAQTKDEIAFQKVKVFLLTHEAILPHTDTVNDHVNIDTLYYNKFEHTLESNGAIIPFLRLTVEYVLGVSGHFVLFKCPFSQGVQCIHKEDAKGNPITISAIEFPFKTKEDCYTFINLLADFKSAINK